MMLRDSAKIQREDAKYLSKKMTAGDPPIEPLYSEDNAREVARLFEYVPFGEWETLGDDVRLRFHHAGTHSGFCDLRVGIAGSGRIWKRLVFTGDLGRRGKPMLNDPVTVERCDVVITESTYGNRVHPDAGDVKAALQRIICEASSKRWESYHSGVQPGTDAVTGVFT